VPENGNEVSVMYGSLVGRPAQNPSVGIQFVFEAMHPEGETWKDAQWLVTVTGSNLERVYHHLRLSRQRFIRIGANEDEDVPSQDGPEVTGIAVQKLGKYGGSAENPSETDRIGWR